MTRRLLAIASFSAPLLVGCFGSDDPKPPAGTAPECQLDSKGEQSPGYPFNVQTFRSDVLPVLISGCGGGSGCHGPGGQGGLEIYADAVKDECNFGKSFNSVAKKVDVANPANSRLIQAPSGGGSPTHPKLYDPAAPNAQYTALKTYVDTAAATYAQGNGGQTTQPPIGDANPFDPNVFKTTIMPIFDATGCSNDGCHGTGAGGFTIKKGATAQADIDKNFTAITTRSDLVAPDKSRVYVKGLAPHSGSKAFAAADAQKLLQWVTDAKNKAPDNGNVGCAPINLFNLGVFTSEILPILNGTIDYNDPNQQGRGDGCMSSACHGQSRGPGSLTLLPSDDPAKTLQNFVCFVDLTSASQSEILLCPDDAAGCRVEHPGGDFFDGADDLNYQKILGYLFSAKSDTTPLDFAFFVRQINPIFNDLNAVEDGAQGRTCSDTAACHGVAVANQAPPNGSDFPIIPNAGDVGTLTFNFVSATGFTNFLNPTQSSLFLYPTDEIADIENNPLATGLPHPGGPDFATNDAEALAILKWAAGLRPDGQGNGLDWLVQGDFPGQQIDDDPIALSIKPKIFDRNGGSFNGGEWDGFFSNAAVVDLNIPFPRVVNPGRIAYATTYVVNTEANDINAQISVNTNNPVRIYVNGLLAGVNDQGGPATAIALLKASTKKQGPTQIMIKLEQRVGDANFAFQATFRDEDQNLLTDATKEVVFTLGPNGGI